jgi:hypothetical protein
MHATRPPLAERRDCARPGPAEGRPVSLAPQPRRVIGSYGFSHIGDGTLGVPSLPRRPPDRLQQGGWAPPRRAPPASHLRASLSPHPAPSFSLRPCYGPRYSGPRSCWYQRLGPDSSTAANNQRYHPFLDRSKQVYLDNGSKSVFCRVGQHFIPSTVHTRSCAFLSARTTQDVTALMLSSAIRT